MARGLLAPLSPNEERSLRHVATGQWRLALLSEQNIRRLAQLDLIEGIDGEVRLTELGRSRRRSRRFPGDRAPDRRTW
jgi:hypothetical protein